jgi:hypothetical protein
MVPGKIVPVTACVLLLTLGAALAQQSAPRPERAQKEKQGEFLRVVRDQEKTPVALEAAIVRCAPLDPGTKGPTVDLVAAVHVAQRSYYRQLNREFAGYDVVLYELVAPEGNTVPRGGGTRRNPLSLLQNAVKNLLELEFQLNEIDYTRKNMVHADMSPEQFAKSMRDRGESIFAMFLRMMGYALARQQSSGKPTDSQLLLALLDKNRALVLKRLMAEEFEDMEGSLMAIDGPEGSTLVGERNKVALKVLGEQLAAGKRKIAIFYGAAHMTDFQRRLREEFRLVPVSTRWLVAWKMESPAQ